MAEPPIPEESPEAPADDNYPVCARLLAEAAGHGGESPTLRRWHERITERLAALLEEDPSPRTRKAAERIALAFREAERLIHPRIR